MAQSGAIVDVVVADDGTLELLGKVGLFVEDFAAAKHSDTFSAVFDGDLLQAPGGKLDGFTPGNKFQFVCFADIGLGQAFVMVQKLVDGKSFDTGIFNDF